MPVPPSVVRQAFGRPAIGVGTLRITPRARQLVQAALDSNRISAGPFVRRFETEFAGHHHCRFGVMSNSGTSALLVALQALKEMHGWKDGDEVIVPAVTFVATANVVLQNRMVPVPVDVDPLYYELDPSRLEAAITPRTRAVIPVHLFGQPADVDAIRAIADPRGIRIIEDSCETMFANHNGRRVGSLGDIGCFSTYVAHLIVTGVGGVNTTNDPDIAVRLQSLINHGRDAIYITMDDDDGKSREEMRTIIGRRFHFTSVGHSARSTELEAALGLAQLEEWQPMIAARRANARMLTAKLRSCEAHLQLPAIRPGSDHSFMMFPIVLRSEPKAGLVEFLEENGVETRDMLPLTNQPVYHSLGWQESMWPVAKWVNDNGFYVGCHQGLEDAELEYMGELFERYFRRHPTRVHVHDGACLVLTELGASPAIEPLLEELPLELFDRRVALVARPLEPAVAELCRSLNIDVVELPAVDPFRAVADGTLPVEQENVVFWPANGRYDPRDVGRLLITLERGHDMVIGSRFQHLAARTSAKGVPQYRSTGNRVFTLLANLLFFGNFTDALNVVRAIRRRKLAEVTLAGDGLVPVYQLSIAAMRDGWNVVSVPVVENVTERQERTRILLSIPQLGATLVREWWTERASARRA